MTKALSTLLFILLFSQIALLQGAYKFSSITTQNGLPDNRVYSSFIDSDGCMWFGTHVGLVKYYGREFKLYLEGEIVKDIIEDHQKNLWIAAWGGGLYFFDKSSERIKNYKTETNLQKPIACNTLSCLLLDEAGKLWIGNGDCGLNYFDPISQEFTNYPLSDNVNDKFNENSINDMLFDKDGVTIWLAAHNGIYKFDKTSRKFLERDTHSLGSRTPFISLSDPILSNPNILWAGTYGVGICAYNKLTGEISTYVPNQANWGKWDYNVIVDIFPKSSNEIWFYSRDQELGIFNVQTKSFQYVELPKSNYLREIGVNGFINQDSQGRLWVGRTGSGIAVHDSNAELFDFTEIPTVDCNLQSANRVTCFGENPEGNLLYVATAGCTGMHIFQKDGQSFRKLKTANFYDGESNNSFTSIAVDKAGNVWLGAKIHPNSGNLKLVRPSLWQYVPVINMLMPVRLPEQDKFNIQKNTVADIKIDDEGNLWLAVNNVGLVKVSFKEETEKLFKLPGANSELLEITDDNAGNLWVASMENGVYKFNKSNQQLERVHPSKENGWFAYLASTIVGENGEIWLGTQGQYILKLDPNSPSKKKMQEIGQNEGLPFNKVTKLVKDKEGNIWATTEKGLSKYDSTNKRFFNFTESDGLRSTFFYRLGLWAARDGTLFIGQSNGFNYMIPDRLKNMNIIPRVIFTSVKVLEQDRPFPRELDSLGQIRLKHHENFLSIGFSAISYSQADKNRYQYKVEGLRDEWIELPDSKGQISLTKLSPGIYTVLVKAANLQSNWSDPIQLKIRILPPWWKTWWAILIYLASLAYLAYFIWLYQLKRRLAMEETKRLKELDELKGQLYANVTHEFRTPLTLIIGLAKRHINAEYSINTVESQSAFRSILQNGQRLLNLVNQMLDVKKLESASLKPNWVKGDIIAYLRYLTESFSSMAQNKTIQLDFHSNLDNFDMDYDRDKTIKIVSNLLFNAIKFTPPHGKVVLEIKTEHTAKGDLLLLVVKDTGIGIEPSQLPRIFDRFYQVDNSSTRKGEGTGIGLNLTKELVELLGGHIEVESIPDLGTAFKVRLPIHSYATVPDSINEIDNAGTFAIPINATESTVDENKEILIGEKGRAQILIVEDNAEVARFIANPLRKKYQVHFAENGSIGIDKALELVPDLIISDVMMPEKDGFEVCQTLKNDERTSHVPIIMLTAKAEVKDRLAGLRRGADAYLSKPFDEEELMVNIENLLKLRQGLIKRYSTLTVPVEAKYEAHSQLTFDLPVEDAFMTRVLTEINKKLKDPDFGAAALCRNLAMSSSQLHRKLSAISDKTPVDLIRVMRLKKAMELLQQPGMGVAEVAYETGFNDPNYFSRIFSREIGMTPTEYKERN